MMPLKLKLKPQEKPKNFQGSPSKPERLEQNLTETVGQLSRMAEDSSKNSEVLEKHIQQLEETRSEFNKLLDQVKEAEQVLQEAREKYEGSAGQVRIIEEKAGGVQRGNNNWPKKLVKANSKLHKLN